MAQKLSKHEAWLFSLTQSTATTVSAQRAAIKREGLGGFSKNDVRKARLAAWAAFRERKENADLAGKPAWLAAARFRSSGDDWRHVSPIKPGKPIDVSSLAAIAYDAIDWGRTRKHQRGSGTAFPPKIEVTTNGKAGWDCVVWRHANYLCAMSPKKDKIAVCVKKGEKITLHPIRNGCFIFRRQRHWLAAIQTGQLHSLTENTAKIFARALRRRLPAGLDCGASGRQVVVRENSTGELYHFDCWSRSPIAG